MVSLKLLPKYFLILIIFAINANSDFYYFSVPCYYYRGEIKFCETELTIDTITTHNNDKTDALKDYLRKAIYSNSIKRIKENLHFKLLINKDSYIDYIETLNEATSNVFNFNNIQQNAKYKLMLFNENDTVEVDITYDSYKEQAWKESDDKNAFGGAQVALSILGIFITLMIFVARLSSIH